MLIGFWTVDEDGDGTLSATNLLNEENPPTFSPSSYVPLSLIGTVSIRELINFEEEPPLRSCGKVEVEDGDDDGDDGDDDGDDDDDDEDDDDD